MKIQIEKIMKKTINNLILIVVFLLFTTSCTDILNQQAVDTFNEDVVFSDINVVNAYLESCYVGMSGPSSDLGLTSRDLFASATDETLASFRPASMPHLKGNMSPDQLGIFNNNSFGGYLRWKNLYSNIQNVNSILSKIDDVSTATTTGAALKKQIKGEAYFIRAYDYTTLLQVYGGAILSDKPFKLGEDFLTIKRSSLAETKDFILKDIEQAISLIPQTVVQGRATRGTVAALKSRLLLFCAGKLTNGGYQPDNSLVSFPAGSQVNLLKAARDAAKDIMDGKYGTYSLVGNTSDPVLPLSEDQIKAYSDNYFYIFDQKGKWNSETIWGIQLPLTGGPYSYVGLNRALGTNAYHCAGNNPPTEQVVRSFEMADGTPFVWDKYSPGNKYLRTATAEQLASDPLRNPYNGREPRFYACILYDGAKWQPRGADYADVDPVGIIQTGHFYYNDGSLKAYGIDTRQALVESWNGTKTGYYTKKFQDPATKGQFENNTNTWVVFRYAEVLLNYAEACIELGGADLQNGLDALNMVRNRAGLPDRITTDQAKARSFLRHERKIELFAEGTIRWNDLRRWMIFKDVVEDIYGMKINHYENGKMEWLWNMKDREDKRSWADDKYYWVPIPRDEINKAPQIEQNPGY